MVTWNAVGAVNCARRIPPCMARPLYPTPSGHRPGQGPPRSGVRRDRARWRSYLNDRLESCAHSSWTTRRSFTLLTYEATREVRTEAVEIETPITKAIRGVVELDTWVRRRSASAARRGIRSINAWKLCRALPTPVLSWSRARQRPATSAGMPYESVSWTAPEPFFVADATAPSRQRHAL